MEFDPRVTLIKYYLARGTADLLKNMVDQGLSLSRTGALFLHATIKAGQADAAQLLIERGVQSDPEHLLLAIESDQEDLVRLLLDCGLNAKAVYQQHSGCATFTFTALNAAVGLGHLEIAKILLAAGAEPNRKSVADFNCMHSHDYAWVARAPWKEGVTPLYVAVSDGEAKLVDLLLRNGAEPQNPRILYTAVASADNEIIQLLLTHGADANAAYLTEPPLEVAVWGNNKEAIQLLKAHGADGDPSRMGAGGRNRHWSGRIRIDGVAIQPVVARFSTAAFERQFDNENPSTTSPKSQIVTCFEKAMTRSGRVFSGRTTFRLHVSEKGDISRVQILASTWQDQPFQTCVTAMLDQWQLETPGNPNGFKAEVTLAFSPSVEKAPKHLRIQELTLLQGGGALDDSVVERRVRRYLPQVDECFMQAAAREERSVLPHGEILAKFTIQLSGATSRVTIEEDTIKNEMLHGCVLQEIRQWNFPYPRGGVLGIKVRIRYTTDVWGNL